MRMHILASGALLLLAFGLSCGNGTPARAESMSATSAQNAEELDRLLAPIALYPDQLLAQILLCAADPQKVAELNKWLLGNQSLKGTELQDAATVAGFEPSFVALALFPQVVSQMAKQLDWTTRLGKAFAANRDGVFDSLQRLRAQAQRAGNLKDTKQQEVETKTTAGGEQVIVIEPANPQVIYVPQYDPEVVYVQSAPQTVVVKEDDSADAAVAGLIGFTAGIAIGAAMDNDYYYGPYGWGGGVYMYNDAWDDWYDHREDAREDWVDHRENLMEERGDRAGEAREQRTDRVESRQDTSTQRTEGRQETRSGSQEQRTQRQENRTSSQAAPQARTKSSSSYEARGHSGTTQQATRERSGTKSDAFSGYSSGQSTRAASSRGQSSRSSASRGGGSRGGGGGGRRR